MSKPSLLIPGNGEQRKGERVRVSLPCKAWDKVSNQNDVIGTIEGHSPVHFSSPCEEDERGGRGR